MPFALSHIQKFEIRGLRHSTSGVTLILVTRTATPYASSFGIPQTAAFVAPEQLSGCWKKPLRNTAELHLPVGIDGVEVAR